MARSGMRWMGWTLLLLLPLIFLCWSLSSCRDTPDTSGSDGTEPGDNPAKIVFTIQPGDGMEVEAQEEQRTYTLFLTEGTETLNLKALVKAGDVWEIVADGETAPSSGEALVIDATRATSTAGQGFTVFYGEKRDVIRLSVRYITYIDLTFEGLGGHRITVRKGGKGTAPNDVPLREGYDFIGWDFDFSKPIYEDTRINARWKAKEYTLSFNAAGGRVTPASMKVTYEAPFELPTPIREGYLFLGWKDGDSFVTSGTWLGISDTTLTAVWDAHDYRITFDAAGGNVQPSAVGVSYGEPYELPTPIRPGYSFDGWMADGVRITGGVYPFTQDMTYVAMWTEVSYTVHYVTNGGEPLEDEKMPYSQIGTVVPTREGYTFKRWFYDPGFTQLSPVPQGNTVTAYACWEEETATYLFDFELTEQGAIITKYHDNKESCVIPATIGGLPVIAIGEGAFADNVQLYYLSFPSTVRSIGDRVFANCVSLARINYSSSVPGTPFMNLEGITSFGSGVFRGCTFTSFKMPSTVTAISEAMFADCKALKTFDFGRVTAIGASAFEGCTGLTVLRVPDFVAELGSSVFKGCTSLTSLTLPSGLKAIPDSLFEGCPELTDVPGLDVNRSLRTVGARAFYGCTRLTAVTLPAAVTSVGESAFECCRALEEVTLPSGVKELSDSIFAECTRLKSLSFAGTFTRVGDRAFMNCIKITSFVFPSGLWEIGEEAFHGCLSLRSVTIPSTLTVLGQSAFAECSLLSKITVPRLITEIPAEAFSGCKNLAEVTVQGVVTSIGERAFAGTLLSQLTFLENIREIRAEAFAKCSLIEGLTVGKDLTFLGERAFSECISLTDVVFNGSSERWKGAVADNAFEGCISYSGRPVFLSTAAEDLQTSLLFNPVTSCYWAMETNLAMNQNTPAAVLRFVPGSVFYRNLVVDDPDTPEVKIVSKDYVWRFIQGGDTYTVTGFEVMDLNDGGYVALDIAGAGFILTAGTAKYQAQLEIYSADERTLLYKADLGELIYKSNTVLSLVEDPKRTDTKKLNDYQVVTAPGRDEKYGWSQATDGDIRTMLLTGDSTPLVIRTAESCQITSYSFVIAPSASCYVDSVPSSWTLYGGREAEDGTVEYVVLSLVASSGMTAENGREYNYKVVSDEKFSCFKMEFNGEGIMFAELDFYIA